MLQNSQRLNWFFKRSSGKLASIGRDKQDMQIHITGRLADLMNKRKEGNIYDTANDSMKPDIYTSPEPFVYSRPQVQWRSMNSFYQKI